MIIGNGSAIATDLTDIESKIDVIDGNVDGVKLKTDTIPSNPLGTANIAVPTADTADNVDVVDVIGNKSDTVAGTSLMALAKQIIADTVKIDESVTLGLLGTHNSTAYRIAEVERHFHGREKWFGLASSPNDEIHRADRMNGTKNPFRLTAGNSTFGAWVQVLGSGDTPVKTAMAYFDFHRILITNTDSTAPFIIQAIAGESADFAAKIAAEEFTEFAFKSATNSDDSGITEFMTSRVAAGTKIWMRCANIGNNGKVLDLYFGLHEYEG